MGWLVLVVFLVVAVAAFWYARKFGSAGPRYLPWWDGRRGDLAQQRYLAEREMQRENEEQGPRDLAP
ncbi:MAG: hypothetical protein AUH85_03030 [Chloroflexi bacterium 13_1_40CM_4_68_4]|nr:MAG: hypothetical protein AUH85_03030 [Chloroflexi bacterium 13_1_40CM_4_68_4]